MVKYTMNKINEEQEALLTEWHPTLMSHMIAYGFFNKVYYNPPEKVFISQLVTEGLFHEWPLLMNKDTEVGLKLMHAFAEQWTDAMLPTLIRDYNNLFVGPDRLLAPPWESVYLSRDHLLFEEETMAVRRFYNRFNLQAPNLNTEPDDHIGLEMAFMANLCTVGIMAIDNEDADALEKSLQAQREFLSNHLLCWGPQFCQKVIDGAETTYFKGAGHLALGCLNTTAVTLKKMVSS